MKKVRFDETKNEVVYITAENKISKTKITKNGGKPFDKKIIIFISLICIFLILFLISKKIAFGIAASMILMCMVMDIL